MKAKELRIGNLIQFGNICEVVTIHAGGSIKVRHPYFGGKADDTGVTKVFPICITEEFLSRTGWVWNDQIKHYVIHWGKNGTHLIKKSTGYDGYELQLAEGRYRVFKYLHELQNLYFALTGEELKLKRGA